MALLEEECHYRTGFEVNYDQDTVSADFLQPVRAALSAPAHLPAPYHDDNELHL